MIKELEGAIKNSKSLVFVNFHGLKVSDETVLRRNLRNQGVSYKVGRKTLLKRALLGELSQIGLAALAALAVASGGQAEAHPLGVAIYGECRPDDDLAHGREPSDVLPFLLGPRDLKERLADPALPLRAVVVQLLGLEAGHDLERDALGDPEKPAILVRESVGRVVARHEGFDIGPAHGGHVEIIPQGNLLCHSSLGYAGRVFAERLRLVRRSLGEEG